MCGWNQTLTAVLQRTCCFECWANVSVLNNEGNLIFNWGVVRERPEGLSLLLLLFIYFIFNIVFQNCKSKKTNNRNHFNGCLAINVVENQSNFHSFIHKPHNKHHSPSLQPAPPAGGVLDKGVVLLATGTPVKMGRDDVNPADCKQYRLFNDDECLNVNSCYSYSE